MKHDHLSIPRDRRNGDPARPAQNPAGPAVPAGGVPYPSPDPNRPGAAGGSRQFPPRRRGRRRSGGRGRRFGFAGTGPPATGRPGAAGCEPRGVAPPPRPSTGRVSWTREGGGISRPFMRPLIRLPEKSCTLWRPPRRSVRMRRTMLRPREPHPCSSPTITAWTNSRSWPTPSPGSGPGSESRPSSSPSGDGPPPTSPRAWAARSAPSRTGSPSTTAAASRRSASNPGPDGRAPWTRSTTPGSGSGSTPRPRPRMASVPSGPPMSAGSSSASSGC